MFQGHTNCKAHHQVQSIQDHKCTESSSALPEQTTYDRKGILYRWNSSWLPYGSRYSQMTQADKESTAEDLLLI